MAFTQKVAAGDDTLIVVSLPAGVDVYADAISGILNSCIEKLIKNQHKHIPANRRDVDKLRRLLMGEILEMDNQLSEDRKSPNMDLEIADSINFLFLIKYALDGEKK